MKEFYGIDTSEVQFAYQDFYFQFERIQENGETLWKKKLLDKKRIIWLNPNNGFTIAALRDLNYEIKLPDALPTFEENFEAFKLIWTSLDYSMDLFYENIESHHTNNEYCCFNCNFPFATVCAELYSQFEPDDPPYVPP